MVNAVFQLFKSAISPAFLSKLKSYNKYNEKTKAPKIAAALVVGLLIFMKVLTILNSTIPISDIKRIAANIVLSEKEIKSL